MRLSRLHFIDDPSIDQDDEDDDLHDNDHEVDVATYINKTLSVTLRMSCYITTMVNCLPMLTFQCIPIW